MLARYSISRFSLTFMFDSGPVLVMILQKEDAVAHWRDLIGPTDARKAKITHPHRLYMFLHLMLFPFYGS